MRGAQDACQDLLCVGAAARSIAAAAHFARDDRRTQRLLGPPVGGVQVGIDEEAEEGQQFDLEMSGEALHVRNRARIREQVQHLVEEMAAGDVDAMGGHRAGGATVRTSSACWRIRARHAGNRARG